MKTLEKLFTAQSWVALSAWVILIVLPFWQAGKLYVVPGIIILLSAFYVYLLVFGRHLDAPGQAPKGSFRTLSGVMELFRSPRGVLVGWTHYLAFDLLVGYFIVMHSVQAGIAHGWIIPCLVATLMLGPSGLLLYLVLHWVLAGQAAFF